MSLCPSWWTGARCGKRLSAARCMFEESACAVLDAALARQEADELTGAAGELQAPPHPRYLPDPYRDPTNSSETKENIMDPDAIQNAETRIAQVQAALDDAQQVLQAAERAQHAAEKSAELMRIVALSALGGLILLSLVHAVRRHH
jgi:hypothetical protein